MPRKQRFVCRHDRFSRRERGFNRAPGGFTSAANQFDKNVKAGIARELDRVLHPFHFPDIDAAVFRARSCAHRDDIDRPPTPHGQGFALSRDLGDQSSAYGA
jgi:hypothetical protein